MFKIIDTKWKKMFTYVQRITTYNQRRSRKLRFLKHFIALTSVMALFNVIDQDEKEKNFQWAGCNLFDSHLICRSVYLSYILTQSLILFLTQTNVSADTKEKSMNRQEKHVMIVERPVTVSQPNRQRKTNAKKRYFLLTTPSCIHISFFLMCISLSLCQASLTTYSDGFFSLAPPLREKATLDITLPIHVLISDKFSKNGDNNITHSSIRYCGTCNCRYSNIWGINSNVEFLGSWCH